MRISLSGLFVILSLLASTSSLRSQTDAQGPAGPWLMVATPKEAGFSTDRLEAAFGFADSVQSGAVMIVHQGRVVAAWGDVARKFQAHSIRKSLTSALIGIAVDRSLLDLDSTLTELGIDDLQRLTDGEKSARVIDLISSRSGVYHPSAYSPQDMDDERPARGSVAPGERFFYNNWDFNVTEAIVERASGEDLYRTFDAWIAGPIGMEDYDPADGYEALEPSISRYPAHTFRISSRDLARFGQLYLRNGRWDGEQVLPEEWVERSTDVVSQLEDGTGYGYLWWVYPAGSLPERLPLANGYDIVQARGTGGQALFVIPAVELVVVHRGDTDNGREVSGRDVWTILEMVLAAREGEPRAGAQTMALAARPFPSALHAPEAVRFLDLDEATLAEYVGEYELAPGVTSRVFLHDGRLFATAPGEEGEAELFATAPDAFTILIESGVSLRFARDEAGRVEAVAVTLGGRTMQGTKRS
jgi:CubicO group peptidase (beta-lactamase class C family)